MAEAYYGVLEDIIEDVVEYLDSVQMEILYFFEKKCLSRAIIDWDDEDDNTNEDVSIYVVLDNLVDHIIPEGADVIVDEELENGMVRAHVDRDQWIPDFSSFDEKEATIKQRERKMNMDTSKNYIIPSPIIDELEEKSIKDITEKYKKMTSPNALAKLGKAAANVIPSQIKNAVQQMAKGIGEAELYAQCMKVVGKGFAELEKQAAKMSLSKSYIANQINKTTKENNIQHIDEICLARGYDISKIVSGYKLQDMGLALLEGGTTGFFGFLGLPFNLVLSTFLYYRAVQTVAMFYGYDVKNNPDELVIASDVFVSALSPRSGGSDEITSMIGKVMLITELTAVKQTAKKTWQKMAERGGIALLLTQIRALAHKSARTALEKAGKKGLEETMFKGLFEQLGKGLTKKSVGKIVPVAGAVVGGLFDFAQMNTIIDFANIFYNKRFLAEKEIRIGVLTCKMEDDILDVDFEIIEGNETEKM